MLQAANDDIKLPADFPLDVLQGRDADGNEIEIEEGEEDDNDYEGDQDDDDFDPIEKRAMDKQRLASRAGVPAASFAAALAARAPAAAPAKRGPAAKAAKAYASVIHLCYCVIPHVFQLAYIIIVHIKRAH